VKTKTGTQPLETFRVGPE